MLNHSFFEHRLLLKLTFCYRNLDKCKNNIFLCPLLWGLGPKSKSNQRSYYPHTIKLFKYSWKKSLSIPIWISLSSRETRLNEFHFFRVFWINLYCMYWCSQYNKRVIAWYYTSCLYSTWSLRLIMSTQMLGISMLATFRLSTNKSKC